MELRGVTHKKSPITNGDVRLMFVIMLMIEPLHARAGSRLDLENSLIWVDD
jgi:hypothetical protein